MKEDQNTISFLKANHLCKTITWGKLRQFVINKQFITEWQGKHTNGGDFFVNQADMISKEILQVLRNKRLRKNRF